jgi:hypothetical protein
MGYGFIAVIVTRPSTQNKERGRERDREKERAHVYILKSQSIKVIKYL